jgi:hypothetical protein
VDNTDWLKAFAIILVAIDHYGYFFIEDAQWWSAFGRLAAPSFFFLMGYAHTVRVPRVWIGLGVVLTLLESWNAGWVWVTPNILLSFALIRLARPYVQALAQRYGWFAFLILVAALLLLLPVSTNIVDYGAEGWLWAAFGLYQRIYVDQTANQSPPSDAGSRLDAALMRILAGLLAAAIYVRWEQSEYAFADEQLAVFLIGITGLTLAFYAFIRGPSPLQPPGPLAGLPRFLGHHTLAIYAIQLAGSELIAGFMPDLLP